jgi:hypothetical protein
MDFRHGRRWRVKQLLMMLAAAAFVSCAANDATELPASGPLPEKDAQIGYKTPAEALDALRQKPGVRVYEHNGWTVAQDNVEPSVWSFTPASHPAHPAVVKRYMQEKDGQLFVRTGVICGASKEACDALVREFDALTRRTIKETRDQKQ